MSERLQGYKWQVFRDGLLAKGSFVIRHFTVTDNGNICLFVGDSNRYRPKVLCRHYLNDSELREFKETDYYKTAEFLGPSRKFPYDKYRSFVKGIKYGSKK